MGYYTQPEEYLQSLLTEHSLLPDSCVFFSLTSRQQALARLIERNVSASEKVAKWLTLPLATRTLAAGLRYCRVCAEEDVSLVGEPYWHVEHQGQATAICLRHGEWLMTLSGVDGHLIAGPAVAHGLEVHPMGGGKIPPIVRDLATLEGRVHSLQATPDLARVTRRALFAGLRRERTGSRSGLLGYKDGWYVFDAESWRKQRVALWDAGLAVLARLQPARITRAIFKMNRVDYPTVMILLPLLRLEVDISAISEIAGELERRATSDVSSDDLPLADAIAKATADLRLCGGIGCPNYDPSAEQIIVARAAQFEETIENRCPACGWHARTRAGRVQVLALGDAMIETIYRWLCEQHRSTRAVAKQLGVSYAKLRGKWRQWRERGLLVNGKPLPSLYQVAGWKSATRSAPTASEAAVAHFCGAKLRRPARRSGSRRAQPGGHARSHGTAEVAAPSLQAMFEASLLGFWTLAVRLNLSVKEQAALLAVSESTYRRWRRETPPLNENVLDRLQLVLRTYAALSALAPVSESEKGRLFRAPGSAESPEEPGSSLLAALSVPSIEEMRVHCQRFESRRHAV